MAFLIPSATSPLKDLATAEIILMEANKVTTELAAATHQEVHITSDYASLSSLAAMSNSARPVGVFFDWENNSQLLHTRAEHEAFDRRFRGVFDGQSPER